MARNYANVDELKLSGDNVAYDVPSMASEWLVNGNDVSNNSSRMVSSGPSASMVDYSCPPIWRDQSVDGHSIGYGNMNVQSVTSPSSSLSGVRAGMNWTPNAMQRDGMFMPTVSRMLPESLPPFPSDSTDAAFNERAARFPWFGGGTFSETLNPFSFPNHLNPCSRGNRSMQGEHEVFIGDGLKSSLGIETWSMTDVLNEASLSGKDKTEWSSFKNEKKNKNFMASHVEPKSGVDVSANQCDEAECSGLDAQQNVVGASAESPVKGLGLKKRKRNRQKPENHENNEASQPDAEKASKTAENRQKGDQSLSSPSNLGGKQETEGSDPPEQGYIHVRARSGQATNSHSLAERVRREKISERMECLQELVPGCSKVTGKAVVLDEIINYVQSLQRQVEFLSMKLATVTPPQLELNMEGFLAKDIRQPGAGLSSFPPMHQSGLHQASRLHMPGSLESTVVCVGSGEPTSQALGLDNAIRNGLSSSAPLTTQNMFASPPPGHMKDQP